MTSAQEHPVELLGYRFHDPDLLERALTHRTWANEHPGTPDNERLEFLGDAVLGLLLADHLFERLPDCSEGNLTMLRQYFVSAAGLAVPARNLDLTSRLRLGRGAARELDEGAWSDTPQGAAVEALIGAVYLDAKQAGGDDRDGGLHSARRVARELWGPLWDQVRQLAERDLRDPISRFYETYRARTGKQNPVFTDEELSKDPPRWSMTFREDGEPVHRREARSRQSAKRLVCRDMLERWEQEVDAP